jgi:UDP-arabinose 4-epimerase
VRIDVVLIDKDQQNMKMLSRVKDRKQRTVVSVLKVLLAAFAAFAMIGNLVNRSAEDSRSIGDLLKFEDSRSISNPRGTILVTDAEDSRSIGDLVNFEDSISISKPRGTILVTGAAGYIGSHTALQLLEKHYFVVGLDNLSRGSQRAVSVLSTFENFAFEYADLGNKEEINRIFEKYSISAVIHLASFSFVQESIRYPKLYKDNIERNTMNVVDSMLAHKVENIVFASSCSVYGNAAMLPLLTEDTPPRPTSQYGMSKLKAEQYITSKASLTAHIMRYFNVVGADPKGRLGANPRPQFDKYGRLWTQCMAVVRGQRSCVKINANQFRDYVHVDDVARANIAALEAPKDTDAVRVWNVASSKKVLTEDFIATAEAVSETSIPICKSGDPEQSSRANEPDNPIGSAARLETTLGWKPRYIHLDEVLSTAWHYDRDKKAETAIIMFDTRGLDVDLDSNYIYHRWTADLNYQYARRHGYDFIYMKSDGIISYESDPAESVNKKSDGVNSKYKTRANCYLELPEKNSTVPRGASWCKLLAVASVLERGYSTVVMIDSDAFFKLDAPDIETSFFREPGDERLVWFPTNAPWEPKLPNGGMQIWRSPSPASWRLLRQWWQINLSPQENCYEQDALWKIVTGFFDGVCQSERAPTRAKACGVGILDLDFNDEKKWKKKTLPNIHIPSVPHYIKLRKKVIRSEWAKLEDARSNNVFDKVEVMPPRETKRLQRVLGMSTENAYC